MVLIKRNSREFKDLKEELDEYADKKGRKKFILLYSLRSNDDLEDRVLINKEDKSGVIYDITLDNVQSYIRNRSKKLFRDDKTALYFFKNSEKSKYIEFPFELRGELKKKVFPLKRVK